MLQWYHNRSPVGDVVRDARAEAERRRTFLEARRRSLHAADSAQSLVGHKDRPEREVSEWRRAQLDKKAAKRPMIKRVDEDAVYNYYVHERKHVWVDGSLRDSTWYCSSVRDASSSAVSDLIFPSSHRLVSVATERRSRASRTSRR